MFSKLFKKKQSKDAKQRFDRQMNIAKEHPDKIFDISSCEISTLPSSLYFQCKVFLAESLILHSNFLNELNSGGVFQDLISIRILDVHNNSIKSLPDQINLLKNLQVLNLNNNQLTTLPTSIGELKFLQTLLVKDNNLTSLPDSIKNLNSLRTLDISGKNSINFLPKTLCYVKNLEVLILSNAQEMKYPPTEVCEEGLEAIQKYICKDCGIDYVSPSHGVIQILSSPVDKPQNSHPKLPEDFYGIESSVDQYRKSQEEKRLRQIEFEKALAKEQEEQSQLALKMLNDKEKNEKQMKEDNEQFEKSIINQHEKSERERMKMLKHLHEVEDNASSVIKKLMDNSIRAKQQEELLKRMEEERIQEEDAFRVTQKDLDALRRNETLAAMESMLKEDSLCSDLVANYLKQQSEAAKMTVESLGADDVKISDGIFQQKLKKENLLNEIMLEEEVQREIFIALQRDQDCVRSRIQDQIVELQQELVKLTQIEAERNKLKSDTDHKSLQSLRSELSDLLVVLLKEKDEREEELKMRLVEIEDKNEDDNIDFWLVQYQRLLDSKPEKLSQKEDVLEDEIIELLQKSNASQYTSAFARHKITTYNLLDLNLDSLRQIGVHEIGLIKNIMREIENFVAHKKKIDFFSDEEYVPVAPSAPVMPAPAEYPSPSAPAEYPSPSAPAESPSPSAPVEPPSPSAPYEKEEEIENECVICMDTQSDCVLLPCGHVCCCFKCSASLRTCPMCRTTITQKIRIFRT